MYLLTNLDTNIYNIYIHLKNGKIKTDSFSSHNILPTKGSEPSRENF